MVATVFAAALISIPMACGSDLDDAQQMFWSGQYESAEQFAAEQVERGVWNERWPRLLIQCQLTTGKYQDARKTYDDAIRRYPTSLTLRMLGLEILRRNNMPDEAMEAQSQILRLLQSSPSRYASRDNLVAAGRYFAMRREDARKILEMFYDRVRDADPEHLDAHIATAELALEKGDFKVAAETLQQAGKFEEKDPRIPYLLARSWANSDSEKATAALKSALELNPNHVPSLLLQADSAIDSEQYDEAEAVIRQVMEINPHEPEAWALLAVLAHLRGNFDIESKMRDAALSTWSNNPRVDHLIGLKLSQKYRFEEGAEYQRKAIELDSRYTPARFQLAQDLLRLGNDEVGWMLAKRVAEEDEYNVVAHNLLTLNDRIKAFNVLERDGIQVRMDAKEAAIYGDAVLTLLSEAREELCSKYDVRPRAPIVVEIFPEQKDFAIRTFGLPGGAGFLGVCFGRVITANSPASQGERPSNWRSVLWHEFCHVVTLEKTKNRMPRWLSEGISVYEERQRDPSWGESMTPLYREMLLDEKLTRVSDLSAAFLNPPSPIHLQFAYYQSSLVVEFLIEQYGIDALKQVLSDLGDGLVINDALARNVGSLEKLDSQFADHAREHAQAFGGKADWSREDFPEQPTTDDLLAWIKQNPKSYWALRKLAEAYIASGDFEKARKPLEQIRDLDAMTGERGDPLEMLARVYAELGQAVAEREVLEEIVSRSSDALPALRRLIEMTSVDQDWELIADYADRVTSINPLLPEGHLAMAEAGENLERYQAVVQSLSALSQLEPVDPASIDYRLAKSLHELNQYDRAKHHALRALDEAPRYRDAHRLLLELVQPDDNETADQQATDSGDSPDPGTAETNLHNTTGTVAEQGDVTDQGDGDVANQGDASNQPANTDEGNDP